MMFHETIERLPMGQELYINSIMSINYYDYLSNLVNDMCDKYGCNNRIDTHHICAFINIKDNNVYMGENSPRNINGLPVSTHAEIGVMRKLNKLCLKKNSKFDVFVIRLSKTHKLGSSRPCYHCINSMLNSTIKIRYVYYSTCQGTIVREKLENMLNCQLTCVSTGWRRRTGCKQGFLQKN